MTGKIDPSVVKLVVLGTAARRVITHRTTVFVFRDRGDAGAVFATGAAHAVEYEGSGGRGKRFRAP